MGPTPPPNGEDCRLVGSVGPGHSFGNAAD
jgi:hypothetical protein